MSGHVILCGLTSLGFRIAEELHLSEEALVVVDDGDDEPALRRRLDRWGVSVLAESSHEAESLLEAGIADATALIACADSDLANLETALLAAELAPTLPLVVRCANPQLGDQLQSALPAARVIGLAGKAGPSFVEACIRSDLLHAFRTGNEVLQVADVPVTTSGPLRQVYGNLTPVALSRPGQPSPEVCPGRDTLVRPGDRLALLGRISDFTDSGVRIAGARDARTLAALSSPDPHAPAAPETRRSFRRWMQDVAGTVGDELDRPFRIALAVLVGITLLSTIVLTFTYEEGAGLHKPQSWGFLDALYLTAQTMTTVGYGDFSFGGASDGSRSSASF